MELRTLKYFLAVAREGSITGAARALHLSQPALTRQIQSLEEELAVKLFTRSSHNVTLTRDGRRLMQRASELADMARKIEAEFKKSDDRITGDIYIGAGETIAMRPIARILRNICEENPGIQIHLHSGNQEDITGRLDAGLLDFCLLIQPANLSKYEFAALPDREYWGAIMRRDHILAEKIAVSREDLRAERLILSRQAMDAGGGNEFLNWFGGSLDQFSVAATYNLLYNAAILAEEGLGIAISLAGLESHYQRENLCFRPLAPRLETGVAIAWKKDKLFSPATELFLQAVKVNFNS